MVNNSQTHNDDNEKRMLHVRMNAETNWRVRIQAVKRDETIQDWVAGVIERELNRFEFVMKGKRPMSRQVGRGL